MLEVAHLAKAWPDFRLDVSMKLGDGEIAALLGPSGCGKSTLLRLLSGLARPDSGTVLMDGRRLDGLGPDKRGIGMVFQDFALFPSMSVRRNIEYGPRMKGLGRAARLRAAQALASSFEIGALIDRSPSTLSGGEQQRVALARTLAAEPKLVLLDEPLSSLDANLRRRLRTEIAERLRAAGVMAIHVTHDVEEAFAVADRVFIMGSGRILEEGAPEELYARPRTAYGARFLGRGPVLPLANLEASVSGPETPRAITAIGAFRCAGGESRSTASAAGDTLCAKGCERRGLALFFPAESARVLLSSAAANAATEDNRVSGRVLDSVFAGRFRRLRLACAALPDSEGDGFGETIEIEVPLDIRPARGEVLTFRVPPEECILLPE